MSNRGLWCGVLVSLAAAPACDDGDKPKSGAPRARSQAVVAAAGPAGAQSGATPAAEAKVREEKSAGPARPLCEPLEGPARKVVPAQDSVSRATAAGAEALGSDLAVGAGKITWINFWAAWCVPCKEEIPRLLAWEKELSAEGVPFEVLFVSLDDDARQLQAFLDAQPAEGLRRTYWLREGSEREEWLAQVSMDTDPRLPAHLVVGKDGRSHCIVDGAVEDGDLAEVRRIVGAAARD